MTERRRGGRSAIGGVLRGRRPGDRERPRRSRRPAARRAFRFGTPLLPLLTAALVATAFLTVREGGENDGNPMGAPSPVATGDAASPPLPPPTDGPAPGASGVGTTGTPTPGTTRDGAAEDDTPVPGPRRDGTPAATAARGATPTRTEAEGRPPHASTSPAPSPTRSAAPAPSGGRKDGRRPGRPVSFEALRVGDCFDIDRDAPGTAVRRPCDAPHSAELVARPRLTGRYATDRAVREAATELCREPLRRKAARQPFGTRWTTFVQYPYRTSHLLGSDTVACSLVVPSTIGGRIGHRLR
ncbi:hypothetical protein [Streptomyces sp. WAC08241]|uniref:hypothetical protein n=1 Tax=Streptomyces sp. WAC08241 TaxID=2487421 RepID=UPI000F785A8D|nr:hypothetical protein [Streptomyces sp. WAC08241]RSS36079.1 hypothetical protein EF906_26080 [Streptomyces sp. WAC08241]